MSHLLPHLVPAVSPQKLASPADPGLAGEKETPQQQLDLNWTGLGNILPLSGSWIASL